MNRNKYAARLTALAAGTALAAHEAAAQVMVVDVNLTTSDVANFIRIRPNGTQFGQATTGVGSPFFEFKVTSAGANVTGTSEMGWIGVMNTGSGFFGFADSLAPGTTIDATDSYIMNGQAIGLFAPPASTFYVGYRYNPAFSGNITYGWVELATANGTTSDLTVVRYGFEMTPNTAIQVPAAVPEPGMTAGVFGVFAAALAAYHRYCRRAA